MKDTLVVPLPTSIDSIVIFGDYRTLPEIEIQRVSNTDSIRFEADVTAEYYETQPRTTIRHFIDTVSRRMIVRAEFDYTITTKPQGSKVDCSPAAPQVNITRAKVFLPEGSAIRITR